MEGREFKAGNTQDAIAQGLSELNLTEEEADIEIISNGGFLKKAVVRISEKDTSDVAADSENIECEDIDEKCADEPCEEAESPEVDNTETEQAKDAGLVFLNTLLKKMGLNCTATVKLREEEILYVVKGYDTRAVIGYRGEVLDALQKLVAQVVRNDGKDGKRVVVDAEFYREKRTQTLTALAKRLARKALETGTRIELEPMNSYERRIIHSALQDYKGISAQSEGEGKDRHIVISPLDGYVISGDEVKTMTYGKTSFTKKGPPRVKSYGKSDRRF